MVKTMKNILSWLKKHLVLTWAVMSVLFAVTVHLAFSITAPTTWIVAKWSAGDILTYAGTISLGLLAFWQNNRFKDENDIAQQRLERLTVHANELTTINKIIEIESAKLEQLRRTFDAFSAACDPQTLTAIYAISITSPNKSDAAIEIISSMVAAEQKMGEAFFSLTRALNSDGNFQNNDTSTLILTIKNYFAAAKEFAEKVRSSPLANHSELVSVLSAARNEFISPRELYLNRKEEMLNKVIYGNLSLQEIKSLYCRKT